MSSEQLSMHIKTLLDKRASSRERLLAVQFLQEQDAQIALDALLQVAQHEDVKVISHAVGWAIAAIFIRKDQVLQAQLADFDGESYLGFDEAVSHYFKRSSG